MLAFGLAPDEHVAVDPGKRGVGRLMPFDKKPMIVNRVRRLLAARLS